MKHSLTLPRPKDVLGIILGCFISALALNMLLVPNKVAPGGASGIAVIIHHFYGINVALVLVLVNVPLFILAWYLLGTRFGINALMGILLLPLFVALTQSHVPVITEDLLLASVYGGILLGIGIGIVFRSQGTTGGTALAAQLLHRYMGLTVGQGILGIDFFVVFLAGVVFDAELAMYGLIAVLVSARVIDLVQQGLRNAKAAFIISNDPQAISKAILDDLQRGATVLEGRGAWSRAEREVLLCVVNSSEITRLKTMIAAIDPHAFVIVTDIQEVLGEGFSR
jgi:uncharacterized membrane-anchored protein YitT (DUF2179 family)